MKIVSFNVQALERASKERVADYINRIVKERGDVDVIALQENRIDRSTGMPYIEFDGFTQVTCQAETYGDTTIGNTLYVAKGKLSGSKMMSTKYGAVPRCSVRVKADGVKIANVHLTGGRFDDPLFLKYRDAKKLEIDAVVDKWNPDIILGDFNSDRDLSRASTVGSHIVQDFPYLSDKDKRVFGEYYGGVHRHLDSLGYTPANEESGYDTSIHGGIVDWIYVKSSVLVGSDVTIHDAIREGISDHNAVEASLTLSNRNFVSRRFVALSFMLLSLVVCIIMYPMLVGYTVTKSMRVVFGWWADRGTDVVTILQRAITRISGDPSIARALNRNVTALLNGYVKSFGFRNVSQVFGVVFGVGMVVSLPKLVHKLGWSGTIVTLYREGLGRIDSLLDNPIVNTIVKALSSSSPGHATVFDRVVTLFVSNSDDENTCVPNISDTLDTEVRRVQQKVDTPETRLALAPQYESIVGNEMLIYDVVMEYMSRCIVQWYRDVSYVDVFVFDAFNMIGGDAIPIGEHDKDGNLVKDKRGNIVTVYKSANQKDAMDKFKEFLGFVEFNRSDRLLFVPMVRNLHWTLAVFEIDNKRVSYYDSIRGHNGPNNRIVHYINTLCEYFFDGTQWPIYVVKGIPYQDNGTDCGVFVLMYAESLAKGLEPPFDFTQSDIPRIREKILRSLQTTL